MKTYRDIAADGGSNVVGQVTELAGRVAARLTDVKRVVAVMSGKGGVGKSSVTVNLAAALALDGVDVGVLDADLNGPSLAKMTGVRGREVLFTDTGAEPAVDVLGVKVMSIDLFLPDDRTPVLWDAPTQRDAFTWRGMMEMAALRELLADTAWGALDILLVDLPPGSDKLPNLHDLLPKLDGTLVITIPSGVSQLVVGRSITMARDVLGTPVLGIVENMAAYVCPHCGETEALFPAGEVEALATLQGVPYLGALPFDPRLALAADAGTPFVRDYPDSPAARAIRRLAAVLHGLLKEDG